ncbi:hypothetical protein BT63DRAFT_168789 [Microthyrium microscopicum]|uniref:Uncharacterized protein n=1 Tax=Microthyrium microscopicum TaxID=703497 RepID=A0A6A6UR07_9PEZI|nr:hypothetical protein BT63DRAFT_168789 [Microthyrium microscopicum]
MFRTRLPGSRSLYYGKIPSFTRPSAPLRSLQRYQLRNFQSSSPRRVEVQPAIIETAITEPAIRDSINGLDLLMVPSRELFLFVHSLGLSWGLAIPVCAMAIRLAFTYINHKRQASPESTNAAAKHWLAIKERAREVLGKRMEKEQNPIKKKDLQSARSEITQWHQATQKRYILQNFNSKAFTIALNFFPWLAMMEMLRCMLGAQYGLLGLMLYSIGVITEGSKNLHPSWFEASMATEGILWFPDLLQPDPTHLLSLILATVSFLPGSFGQQSSSALTQIGRSLSLALAPLTMQFPAGLLLCWIGSATVNGAVLGATALRRSIASRQQNDLTKPLQKSANVSLRGEPTAPWLKALIQANKGKTGIRRKR